MFLFVKIESWNFQQLFDLGKILAHSDKHSDDIFLWVIRVVCYHEILYQRNIKCTMYNEWLFFHPKDGNFTFLWSKIKKIFTHNVDKNRLYWPLPVPNGSITKSFKYVGEPKGTKNPQIYRGMKNMLKKIRGSIILLSNWLVTVRFLESIPNFSYQTIQNNR